MEKSKPATASYQYIDDLLTDLHGLEPEDGPMIREVLEDYSQQDLEQLRNECSRVRKMALKIFKARQPKQEKKK